MSVPWQTFTATTVFNRCAIHLPASGTIINDIEIPLHLTKLQSQEVGAQVLDISTGPVIDLTSNLASGGMAVGLGSNQLAKINLEGWVDTPVTANQIPALIIDGNNVSYGDILAAYFEGRTALNSQGAWTLVKPSWFRDPYGRVYLTPRIIDLTIQRTEAVPQRQNFTMTLQVS